MRQAQEPLPVEAMPPSPEQAAAIRRQVERLLESDQLKGSRTLHRLLRFLVEAKLGGREDELKETVLAAEVFDRKTGFDGRDDPVARVHAHRLRKKLKEYYEGPGAGDAWVLDIPAGAYIPSISNVAGDAADFNPLPPPEPITPRRTSRLGIWAAVTAAVALGAALGFAMRGPREGPIPPPSSVERLWAPFLDPAGPPATMVFNETVFLSNEKVLLRYNGPYSAPTGAGFANTEDVRPYVDSELLDVAGPLLFNRTYASAAHVYCVRALTLLFAGAGKALALRPFRLLRPDEAAGEHLILTDVSNLAAANQSLVHFRVRPGSYGYKSPDQPAIENVSPRDGESERFTIGFDERTQERKIDYAVVAWLPGRRPRVRVALMDGLTAAATWAAAKALTTREGVEELERLLGDPLPTFFEAVVRADIDHDQVMGYSFVAARPREE